MKYIRQVLTDRMSALSEMTDDLETGIVVFDPDTGEILDVNDAVERLSGYSTSEIESLSIEELSAEMTAYSQERGEQLVRAAATGSPQGVEWRVKRADGELVWVSARLKRTTLDDTPVVIAEIEDITDLKERERRLRLLNRITRHNLRNKVSIVDGYAGLLAETLDDTEAIDQLQRMRDASDDLFELTTTIRNLKSITDPDHVRQRPIDLSELVTEAVEEYRTAYPEVEWSLDCEAGLCASAGEPLRIALEEGVENAAKHNTSDDPVVHVTATESAETGQPVVRIEDNGPSIPTVEKQAVADDYDPQPTAHGEGIGFWMMHSIVELFGGRLAIETDSGGNTVAFFLPPADSPPTESVPMSDASATGERRATTGDERVNGEVAE